MAMYLAGVGGFFLGLILRMVLTALNPSARPAPVRRRTEALVILVMVPLLVLAPMILPAVSDALERAGVARPDAFGMARFGCAGVCAVLGFVLGCVLGRDQAVLPKPANPFADNPAHPGPGAQPPDQATVPEGP